MHRVMNPDFQPRRSVKRRNPQIPARILFANWLMETNPYLYEKAIAYAKRSPQLSGLGAADKSFWQKFTEGAAALGTTYLSLKNQRDAMKINLERAKMGQPPIDMATSAPVIRTQVSVDPNTARELMSGVGAGVNKTLLFGGAAALGLMLYLKKR